MVRIILFIFILQFLISCIKKPKRDWDKGVKYYWVMWRGHEYTKADTLAIHIEKSFKGDTMLLKYFDSAGYTSYCIINYSDSSFLIENPPNRLLHLSDPVVYIRSFRDTTIYIDKDTFKVRIFIQDENIQDGATIIYYEPTFGFYAGHSDNWPGLKMLQSSDTAINRKIRSLVLATIPKFFIRNEILK